MKILLERKLVPTLAALATGLVAVGYRKRFELRWWGLRTLAHGAPVIMNTKVVDGGVSIDQNNAVLYNVDLTAVDYRPLHKAAQGLAEAIEQKAQTAVGLKFSDNEGANLIARVGDCRVSNFGIGMKAPL